MTLFGLLDYRNLAMHVLFILGVANLYESLDPGSSNTREQRICVQYHVGPFNLWEGDRWRTRSGSSKYYQMSLPKYMRLA